MRRVRSLRSLQSVQEGEELLRCLHDVMPGGVVHVARDGTLASANQDARRILGPAPSIGDWESRTLNEDGSPGSGDDLLVSRVLATGQGQGPRTIGVRREGGDTVWVVGRAAPVRDPEGNLAGAIATFLDITASREADEKLRRSEEKWRFLAESVPDSVSVIDADGRFLSINHVFPELDVERVLRLSVYDFISDEVVDEYRAHVAKAFASRSLTRFETRGYGQNGVTAWYDTILVPLIDGGGERILVVARDITDRKRAEEEIAASELRWRALVGSLPDSILVVDRERTILSVNRDVEHTRVIGTKCDSFIDEPMLEAWLRHFKAALATGMPVRLETRGWSAPGRLSWYESVLVPLKSGDIADRVMIVARDITERRAMLAELAEKERLASVGMVAASVAHEVMNPLTHILANLDVALGARQLDETSRMQAVVEARVAARRMQQIVWDLRALGRAGADELFYVDVRSVLEIALRLCGPEINGVTRVVLELEEVPGVFASESRLCQVFINLLVNAAQAMGERVATEREVRVRTRHDEAAGLVAIDVADTGVGIASQHLPHIFEPFYTTKQTGTGLGLAISRDILHRMGGRIAVESKPGQGTTFTVWLSTTRAATVPSAESSGSD